VDAKCGRNTTKRACSSKSHAGSSRNHYRGNLKPGQIIKADVLRLNAEVTVDFELIRKGQTKFTHEAIPNMVSREEIHAHFRVFDHYIQENNRLKDSTNAPEMLGEDGGVAGGTNSKGQALPPVIFPKSVDTTGGTKMQ
jgi:hypothetical protein